MPALTIHELPEQERPRERLENLGAAALTDSELIAILLRVGVRGASAIDLGRQLLEKYGSIMAVARCSVKELQNTLGIGRAKAVQLAAAFELGHRMARERLVRRKMDKPALIFELLGSEMRALAKESLRVVLLDTKLPQREHCPSSRNFSACFHPFRLRVHSRSQSPLRRSHAERRGSPPHHPSQRSGETHANPDAGPRHHRR
jgi:hypothetical protein